MSIPLSRRSFFLAAPSSAAIAGGLVADRPEILDPLLDPRCTVRPQAQPLSWNADWIWYPGQLTAHLQADLAQKALARCANVGYPGRYRQAERHAAFRKSAELTSDTTIRWAGPSSRVRLLINGADIDVTRRSAQLRKGVVELLCEVDFAGSLPCLILEGDPFRSGAGWEASLDHVNWVKAESEPAFHCPGVLPDLAPELTVAIPPRNSGADFSVAADAPMLVDFGHDELGRLAFEVSGTGSLTVTVGESAQEARNANPRFFEQKALPPVALNDSMRTVQMPERCVRFAQFSSTGPAHVRALRLDARVSPVEYKGSFECSDPALNDLWRAAAATLHSNLHTFYLDGIKRDALCWWDSLLVAEAGDAVFFDTAATRHSILSLTLPEKPSPGDLGIIDTPLYVMTATENDYLVRGDLSFAERYRDRLEGILTFFTSLQDANGFVDAHQVQPYGYFPDWSATAQSGPDPHGAPAYGQMLLMRAFEVGADFEKRLGDEAKSTAYRKQAVRLRSAIQERFWDPQRRAYLNGIDAKGQLDTRISRYAQTYAILTGLAPHAEWSHLIDSVLDNPKYRPANWSIGQQWEFLAFAKAGKIQPVVDRIKADWGAARRRGYVRLIEDIRPGNDEDAQLAMYGQPFGNSLCHAWAGSAVILALTRGVLGVWPTGPGYSTCRIDPQSCGIRFVRGTVPTPRGPITVEVEGGRVDVSLPPATQRLS
jgi:hypothetical protein